MFKTFPAAVSFAQCLQGLRITRPCNMPKRASQGTLEGFFKRKQSRVAAGDGQVGVNSRTAPDDRDNALAKSHIAQQQKVMWGSTAPMPSDGTTSTAASLSTDAHADTNGHLAQVAQSPSGQTSPARTAEMPEPSRPVIDSSTTSAPGQTTSPQQKLPLAGPFAAAKGIKAQPSKVGPNTSAALSQPPTVEALAEWHATAIRMQEAAEAVVLESKAEGRPPKLHQLLVEPAWRAAVGAEFNKPYMKSLQTFLDGEWASQTVYPPAPSIFRALNSCPFSFVKVVILGQDPYFGPNQVADIHIAPMPV
mmetsp:Transcript_20179/g.60873  ORF Transcript_20179/g.60873 Transcript_20179/m.60873 type:complete len:306 (+) Transcript_20179:112-1029(+)